MQPAVTVRGLVTTVFAGSPEVALMSTAVVCATEFAAWIVSAPPPVVQPGWMTGWAFAIAEATAGLLLVTWMGVPCGAGSASAGAMCARTASNDTPPGAMVDGESVNEASGGGRGVEPPGCR